MEDGSRCLIPGCMGAAVYGISGCTCPPRPKRYNAKRIENLAKQCERLADEVKRLAKEVRRFKAPAKRPKENASA